ncbi:MAG: glycerol-3-phosphate dehydrogenase subunit GlpB [Solirubrobacteraceae bacterium]
MSHHDVVVVGTGLAGLTAALRLAESGARVLVVAKGVGATHLAPGTIDVLGYAGGRVERPGEALGPLLESRPDHPYGHVGADGVAAAVAWFKDRVANGSLAPYAYVGGLDENLLLPTAVGAPRPSAVVPVTMAGGDLRGGGPVCAVSFRALKDFHAALLADNLVRSGLGVPARAVELDLAPERRLDVNALGFARGFDDPAFRRAVVAQLAARLGAQERVAFPAVLGIADPHGVWAALEHELGRPVFEVPTLPPSVPGMRLFAILREALRRAGGTVVLHNVVTGAEQADGRVTALRIRVGLREERRGADWVVLATGGFASGGLELDSRWVARETALGLPVTGVPAPGEERFRPRYLDAHPMGRAGIAVDRELRPVDGAGERVMENVLVVGATLAGAEPWREKSGDGLSLATGHRAAELVLAASMPAGGARAAAARS